MLHELFRDVGGLKCRLCGAVWIHVFDGHHRDDECPGMTSLDRRERLTKAAREVQDSSLMLAREWRNIDWSLVAFEVSKRVGVPCGVFIDPGYRLIAYELPVSDTTL